MINSTVTSVNQTSTNSGIYASSGKVVFSATASESVAIYTIIGQKLVRRLSVEGVNTIPVSAKGIFLVKVGNRIAKVIL